MGPFSYLTYVGEKGDCWSTLAGSLFIRGTLFFGKKWNAASHPNTEVGYQS